MTENRSNPERIDDGGPRQAHKARRLIWWGGAGVALLVVMVVYVNLGQSRPLRISKETTYLTEPLKSDGKQVDYFAAIRQATRPDNAATDENGYRLFVRHLGKHPDTKPAHFAELCEELGLDAGAIRPSMTYQGTYDFLESYVESDQFDESLLDRLPPDGRTEDDVISTLDDRLAEPWSLDDFPMMAAWLESNGPALDLMSRAVRKPLFYIPVVRETGGDQWRMPCAFDELMRMQSFADGLIARANYRVATGDIDGAIDDILTCSRLGRHVARRGFAIDLMCGIGFEQSAHRIGIVDSLQRPPAKEHIRRLIEELDDLPPAVPWRDAIRNGRFRALDFIQAASHGNASWQPRFVSEDHWETRCVISLGINWNHVARRFNEIADEALATGRKPPDLFLSPPPGLWPMSAHARARRLAELLYQWGLSSWQLGPEAVQSGACVRHIRRITLAMLLYERHHGTLPPAWSANAAGNPLHSWRVLLLPYLGYAELYERIRLDEPWDSEHNRQFHGEAMPVYRCPSHFEARPGQTAYSVVVGSEMPFEAAEGKRLADFDPHSDDMILVVERTDPVGWMDPVREITQAAAEQGIYAKQTGSPPSPGRIGNYHPDVIRFEANFGFRNGAVRRLAADMDRELFVNMLRGANAEKTIDY